MFYTPFFDLTWSFFMLLFPFFDSQLSFFIFHLSFSEAHSPSIFHSILFIQFKLLFQKRIRIVWRINKKVLTLQMKYKDE